MVYDVALWKLYKAASLEKFWSFYNKCTKLFVGYGRRESITRMLYDLGLPSFNAFILNAKHRFNNCCSVVDNNNIVASFNVPG